MSEPSAQGGRIPGLDAWRAGLMLTGLLVHGSYLQESRPLFDAVSFVSAQFRMGVFMVISGLLSGIATTGHETRGWVRRRVLRIAVPLLTGLAVTGPTVAILGHVFGLNDRPTPSPITVHHLWFLLALLLYLPLIIAFEAIDRRFGFVDRLERSRSGILTLQLVVLGLTCVGSVALMSGTTVAFARLGLSPVGANGHAHYVVGYAPMFLMGFLLGRAPVTLSKLMSDFRGPVTILIAVLVLQIATSGVDAQGRGNTLAVTALIIGLSTSPVLSAVLVLRSALAIRSVGPLVRRLSGASLTMYIVHFPLAAMLNIAFGRVTWNVYVEYAITVILTGLLSYGFHAHVVDRSPFLATLFNGRSLRQRTASAASTSDDGVGRVNAAEPERVECECRDAICPQGEKCNAMASPASPFPASAGGSIA